MMIYLDHAATAPLSKAAGLAWQLAMEEAWGNPSQNYEIGRRARACLEKARQEVAELLCALPEEIYFTSGGTEGDNWALQAAGKGKIVTSQIEHAAILASCRKKEEAGQEIVRLPVDAEGTVCLEDAEKALPGATLLSVMTANNEIGTLQPIARLTEMAHACGTLMHTDAVQAAGQINIDLSHLGVDLLTLSGHKFGAPRGIGVLFIRKGTRITPFHLGGEQERGLRAGTENVAGAAALAAALREAVRDLPEKQKRLSCLRDRLETELLRQHPDLIVNGNRSARLPGMLHLSVPGMSTQLLLTLLDLRGICASGGSACASGVVTPSHVMQAIGRADMGSLRFSLGLENTEEEIDEAAGVIGSVLERRKI